MNAIAVLPRAAEMIASGMKLLEVCKHFSMDETNPMLGVSPYTIRDNLYKARAVLKGELKLREKSILADFAPAQAVVTVATAAPAAEASTAGAATAAAAPTLSPELAAPPAKAASDHSFAPSPDPVAVASAPATEPAAAPAPVAAPATAPAAANGGLMLNPALASMVPAAALTSPPKPARPVGVPQPTFISVPSILPPILEIRDPVDGEPSDDPPVPPEFDWRAIVPETIRSAPDRWREKITVREKASGRMPRREYDMLPDYKLDGLDDRTRRIKSRIKQAFLRLTPIPPVNDSSEFEKVISSVFYDEIILFGVAWLHETRQWDGQTFVEKNEPIVIDGSPEVMAERERYGNRIREIGAGMMRFFVTYPELYLTLRSIRNMFSIRRTRVVTIKDISVHNAARNAANAYAAVLQLEAEKGE
jgi:hypothetical protein